MVAGDNVEKNSSSKIDMANYSLRRLVKVQFPNKCFALKKKHVHYYEFHQPTKSLNNQFMNENNREPHK